MASGDDPVSPVGASKPELTITAASVLTEPAELDSTPTGASSASGPASLPAEALRRRGSQAQVLEQMSPAERERREQVISERKTNPAVLVDIPQSPGAEEFTKSDETTAGDGWTFSSGPK